MNIFAFVAVGLIGAFFAVFMRKMGEEYPGIHIFVENIFDFDPDMICQLAKQMEGEPYFGICLDYAHATISRVGAPQWFEKLKPYIKHIICQSETVLI